jgi:hypothetical protein
MIKFQFSMRAKRGFSFVVLVFTILPEWSVAATSITSGFSESPDVSATSPNILASNRFGGDVEELFPDGFDFFAALSGTYNSNIDQRAAPTGKSERDDFIMGIAGGVNYLSKARDWTFGGNYNGKYNQYFDYSDFSGYNQGGGVVVNYQGGRLSGQLRGDISYDEGTNRDYDSSFVKMLTYSAGGEVRYRVSSKTIIEGEIGQKYTSTLDDDFGDTESFNLAASALWQYSPLTEFGPGVRYTYRSGTQAGRSTIGPTLNLNYKLSSKVSLTSRGGVEFASYEDGGDSDPFFSTSVAVNYQASRLWGMNITLERDAEADPTVAGAFSEKTSVAVGYVRKLRRATLGLGVSYSTNAREFSDKNSSGTSDDRDYFSVKSNLGMLIFSKTTTASVFLQYSEQTSDKSDSWDAIQTGISLSRNF